MLRIMVGARDGGSCGGGGTVAVVPEMIMAGRMIIWPMIIC